MRNQAKTCQYAIGLSLLLALSGCISDQSQIQSQHQPPPVAVGADRDAHACIGSAGYAWCAKENACVRPWELASQKGFESNAKEFERFCSSASK